jgi:hypothetical protein
MCCMFCVVLFGFQIGFVFHIMSRNSLAVSIVYLWELGRDTVEKFFKYGKKNIFLSHFYR